jgi:peptidoglycan/xylan/chitin deacetylase (PgdA/CDA1 family)
MSEMKRVLALVLCLCLCAAAAAAFAERDAETEELLKEFILRHGSRQIKKIALTVDDCYKNRREWITYDVELCKKYGIKMTFFPLVYTGCLSEEYRDIWQGVLDAGCEIGSHTNRHVRLGNRDKWGIIGGLGNWQESLDKTLGYHYEGRWMRPPTGNMGSGKYSSGGQVIECVKRFGYDHVVLWDVSETYSTDKALNKTQNGSILLFHAQQKDSLFLDKLIPLLQEQGYEMVTVSELFGFDPPETSDELYVFDKKNYEEKK